MINVFSDSFLTIYSLTLYIIISYKLTVLLSLVLENRPSCIYAFANIFVTFAYYKNFKHIVKLK